MRIMEAIIAKIGSDLLQYAADSAEFSASRGLVSELFPYIYAASRTMSSRAISRWLEEQQQIKLSAVTISKALREPEKHWTAYAEDLEPSIRIFEEAYDVHPETFLVDYHVFEHLAGTPPQIAARTHDDARLGLDEFDSAIQNIRENWYRLPDAARKECISYLLPDESDDEKTE